MCHIYLQAKRQRKSCSFKITTNMRLIHVLQQLISCATTAAHAKELLPWLPHTAADADIFCSRSWACQSCHCHGDQHTPDIVCDNTLALYLSITLQLTADVYLALDSFRQLSK